MSLNREGFYMRIKVLHQDFSVCKVSDYTQTDMNKEFVFTGKTDEELSLVCPTDIVPQNTTDRDDGWRGMRIEGTLDFSLIGILAKISAILADNKIGIFVVSTYNTDYVLTKAENFDKAITLLKENGYEITE